MTWETFFPDHDIPLRWHACGIMLVITLFLLVSNALPSRRDVRVACNWKSVLLYGSVCGVLWYVWGHYSA